MRNGPEAGRTEQEDSGTQLEEEATRLLREAGAFRRGSEVLSPRAERAAARGRIRWEEWLDHPVVELGPDAVFATLAELADALRLSQAQRDVLYLMKVEELSYRKVARVLGVTVWRVRVLLRQAEEGCRLVRHAPPVSLRGLFWDEIRQKKASVYRAPHHWRGPARRQRRKYPLGRRRAPTGKAATGRGPGEAGPEPVA